VVTPPDEEDELLLEDEEDELPPEDDEDDEPPEDEDDELVAPPLSSSLLQPARAAIPTTVAPITKDKTWRMKTSS